MRIKQEMYSGADAYLTAHPLVIKNETRISRHLERDFSESENPIHIEIVDAVTVSSDTCKGVIHPSTISVSNVIQACRFGAGTL